MESIWKETSKKKKYPSLSEDIKTDVVIIGGGMAGLLCAKKLKDLGVDYVLVEKGEICSGVTQNTTAKITFQHGLCYDKMIRRFGIQKAYLYLEAQKNALMEYDSLCQNIPCDYERKDAYVYSLASREKIIKEINAYQHLGVKAEFSEAKALPFQVSGAVKVKDQAQFHPLKFAYFIAKDLNILENTSVLEIREKSVLTSLGQIFCKKIIVTTHFPILNKYGAYFLKMYQHRSYVLALSGAAEVDGMYVDENEKGLSFRNYRGLLLLGGGAHRTGKKGGSFWELEEVAKRNFPAAQICTRFATQDCMTLDEIPYIGVYSPATPNLFVATGFHKWGMTASMVASQILSDLVLEKKNEYASVFSSSRSIFRPRLAENILESVWGLLRPSTPRCSHLGCALTYNRAEHSWDCSCHGSRFTSHGEVIDNPAIFPF